MSVERRQSSSPSSVDALESAYVLAQMDVGAVLQPLLDHPVGVLLPVDLREPRDVEDVLLGVHGGHLAAELLEALDDAARRLTVARVVGGGQAGGARADDRHVDDVGVPAVEARVAHRPEASRGP